MANVSLSFNLNQSTIFCYKIGLLFLVVFCLVVNFQRLLSWAEVVKPFTLN